MRWIFFILLTANLVLLSWRALVGLPSSWVGAPSSAAYFWQPHAEVGALTLLSELQVSEVDRWRTAPKAGNDDQLCVTAGPFDTPKKAEQFIERLKVLDVLAVTRNLRISGGKGYWVYLAPESSAQAARQRLAELQVLGIDSYIIPKGDLSNGISLGMFSQQKLAEARVEEMAARGLRPKIHEVERSHHELWVFLPAGEEQKLNANFWNELVEQVFQVEERQNFCLDVASRENFQ